jgi:hypothetical protein
LDVVRVGEGSILREFDEFGFRHLNICEFTICKSIFMVTNLFIIKFLISVRFVQSLKSFKK